MAAFNPDQPRSGKGRFEYTLTGAERDRDAAKLREQGLTYQAIADQLGFCDKGEAHHAVRRVLTATVREAGDALRAIEDARLDAELVRLNEVEAVVWEVLKKKHVTVSNGKVIYLGSDPLEDDAPVLLAVDRLMKIEDSRRRNGESRRKLHGLDAEKKISVSGGVRYEIVGVDADDLS